MLLLIDFEKAFDSLEWDYLESVLKVYYFRNDFRTWFSILYKNSSSCVINNGFFTDFFTIERSCRQGDPLSPYLFILAIEPMASTISNSDKVKGLVVNEKHIKIGQYADDTFLLLNDTDASVKECFHILQLFEGYSGLKINIEKTQVVWLGDKRYKETLHHDSSLNWATQFELLGIIFDVKQEKVIQLNFDKKISQIDKILNMYSKFKLSLIGRVNVLKTLALPKLVYLFTVLPTPPKFVFDVIEKKFKDFLWNKSTVKINKKQLEKDISEGGLKLINIQDFNNSLKLSWLKRLLTMDGGWQNILEASLGINKKIALELDVKSLAEIGEKCLNPFWKYVLHIWEIFKLQFGQNVDCRTYPIWGTYFMKNKNLLIRSAEVMQKGVRYVNDILTNTGQLLGFNEFKETYPIAINFVDFYGMMHSIPREWLKGHKSKLNESEMNQRLLQNLLQQKQVSKWAYKKMRSLANYSRGHELKWAEILEKEIDKSEWTKYYQNNYLSVIEASLRAFQYNILLRTIPTQKFLAKCKLVDSDKCWFCKESVETIEHLFWFCPIVKTFSLQILEVIQVNTDIRDNISATNLLLGGAAGHKKDSLNYLFTLIKKYVYNKKCNEKSLSIWGFKNLIRHYYMVENWIVKNDYGTVMGYADKWEMLNCLIEPDLIFEN